MQAVLRASGARGVQSGLPGATAVSHSLWLGSEPFTQAKKRDCSSRVSGPGRPSPMRRLSSSTTG